MTAELFQDGMDDEKQKTIFASFQFSAGATLTNYLSSCAALFPFLSVPIIIPLVVVFVFKFFGANLTRIYLYKFCKEEI